MRWDDDKSFNKIVRKFNDRYTKFLKNKSQKEKLSDKEWRSLNKTIDKFEELFSSIKNNKYQGWLVKEQLNLTYQQCDNLILWSRKYEIDGSTVDLLERMKFLLNKMKLQEIKYEALQNVSKHISKIALEEENQDNLKSSEPLPLKADTKSNTAKKTASHESDNPASSGTLTSEISSMAQQAVAVGNSGRPLSFEHQNASTEISISISEAHDEHNDPRSSNFLVDIIYKIKDFIVNLSNTVVTTVRNHPRLFIGIGLGGVVLLLGGVTAALVLGKVLAAPTVASFVGAAPASSAFGGVTMWLLTKLFPLTMSAVATSAILSHGLNLAERNLQNENNLVIENTYNHVHKKFEHDVRNNNNGLTSNLNIEINEQDQINLPVSLAKLENELNKTSEFLNYSTELLAKYSEEKRDLNNTFNKICKEFFDVRQQYAKKDLNRNDNSIKKPLASDTQANLAAKIGSFKAEDGGKQIDKGSDDINIASNWTIINNK